MDPKEYQRKYRAKRKAVPAQEETRAIVVPEAQGPRPAPPPPTRAIRRERVEKDWSNPYTDGLPDWPELIQRMNQHQRDAILDRLPKAKR